jgi:two-component system sensor histidine kinase MtrB
VPEVDRMLARFRDWPVWSAIGRSHAWHAWRRGPGRWLYRGWRGVRRTFRRSLQARVVSITLVLSSLLVASFGFLVVGNITKGLLDDRRERARLQVVAAGRYAVTQLWADDAHDRTLNDQIAKVLAALAPEQTSGSHVQVAIVRLGAGPDIEDNAAPNTKGTLAVVTSPALDRLRAQVQQRKMVEQIITADPDQNGLRPFLAYGTLVRIQAGDLGLFFLFPLDTEVHGANLTVTTVTVTGFTLVVLLAVVAGLVTQLVVRPVRVAARTAQRLSAGLLDQRMDVRGEDDLARLATSFNQMAANLQRQIVRLEEMSRLQRRFTSDVSHELRTPLTTVRMAADLIFTAREDFDPAVSRSAELLQAELDRFEDLLTDLLEISRFDAGFAVLDAEPADLVAIVHRVTQRLASLAERLGSPLVVNAPEYPVIAEVDPRRVERILRNLVGNAVEHSEHRPVQITLGSDDAAVAITVRDSGVGLRPGEEKLVFNRFWRADPSRARQTGGTGLGLSISLEDARLHGGWLEAWGAPGEGAQFRLTLPLHSGDRLTSSPLSLEPLSLEPLSPDPPLAPPPLTADGARPAADGARAVDGGRAAADGGTDAAADQSAASEAAV